MGTVEAESRDGGPVKIHDCEQRSPQWFAARVGKFTASRAADMMATIKSGEAAARRDLRVQLVCERLTGQSQEDNYVNAAMQRGIDKESDALAAYEALTGNLAMSCGFLEHDTLPLGCSPDGLISDRGGLELKCPKTSTHLGYLKAGTLPKEYVYQVAHSLLVTGFDWWDFLSFDDRLPAHLQTFYVRVQRKQPEIDAYELMARAFLSEIDREVEEVSKLGAVAVA